MKTIIVCISLLIFLGPLSGQINLEQTYNHSGTLIEIAENEYKYFVMDVPLSQCRIYNEDHTIYKTINLEVPGAYYLYDIKLVTKDLFNSDDNIELLYIYQKTTTVEGEIVYQYGMKVVNELGTVLMSLSNGGYAELKEGSDGLKLLAYQYIYYDYYYLVYTNVYDLGGTTKSAEVEADPAFNFYPNPTSDIVTITLNPNERIRKGKILITDMNGRIISNKALDPNITVSNINTEGLSSGTYVMSLLSNDRIVSSEKLEIK